MVVINKGLANELYFNLTSKKRLASSPYIFIKFTNDMTKQSYFVNPTATVEIILVLPFLPNCSFNKSVVFFTAILNAYILCVTICCILIACWCVLSV